MEPIATCYVFMPAECMVGDPLDRAHMHNPHAITVEWRGGDRWAVLLGSGWTPQRVWDDEANDWTYEPIPSERGKGFLRRCRFTLHEALAIGRRLSLTPAERL